MTDVYELDGSQMQTPGQAHGYLKKTLHFPEYYGENADALFDCLTELSGEVILFLHDSEQISANILKTMEEASEENPLLILIEQ